MFQAPAESGSYLAHRAGQILRGAGRAQRDFFQRFFRIIRGSMAFLLTDLRLALVLD